MNDIPASELPPSPPPVNQSSAENSRIDAEILRQVAAIGPGKSICPSEVSRALDPDWQKLSTAVRRAAIRLAEAGRIDILRKGKRVAPAGVKGVIRLRLPLSD